MVRLIVEALTCAKFLYCFCSYNGSLQYSFISQFVYYASWMGYMFGSVSEEIIVATSLTAPGPCGMNTAEDFEEAPISFIVSKYCVTRTMSMISFAVVPGTFSENASTLSLSPSTMAWRCRAIPSPDRRYNLHYNDKPNEKRVLRTLFLSTYAGHITCINLIHSSLDMNIRLYINNKGLNNLISISRHGLKQEFKIIC
ncbi:hypothetical protein Ahy_B04g073346 isoform E [Arachis hypogaea]|uniref:Uncharacterized protein n=1 Tax=Arachis hypogaea TaxID=3818 RepID=A0A444ZQA2_ARAHY|nr:hypothetical protein Ahy_B04g073346 isoform E [Arachis hypogaea]